MTKKLYVGNLNYATTGDRLREVFAAHGEVASANVVTDRDSGRSRGFGFVEMSSDAEAEAAINALNGQTVDGRPLKVAEAKPREPRREGGYHNSGGRRDSWDKPRGGDNRRGSGGSSDRKRSSRRDDFGGDW